MKIFFSLLSRDKQTPGRATSLAPEDELAPAEPDSQVLSADELPPAADVLAELFPGNPAESEPIPAANDEDAESAADAGAPPSEIARVLELPSPAPSIAEPFPAGESADESNQLASTDSTGLDHATPGQDSAPPAEAPPSPPATPPEDWALAEKLANHGEWIESHGATGKQAALAAADLEGADLIGVNLRFADLHQANLKASDLLLADLRDSCLARANLEDACLVGANLEGANLEGASLATAMGLVPRQLAGANLHGASLPASVLEFHALGEFDSASRTAFRLLATIIPACLLSWLAVWKTKDAQLLSNSSIFPFLHSQAAAAVLPAVQFYCIAPVALFVLYVVFHYHLQRLWDAVLELPAVFPDGHTLSRRARENGPRVILDLLRAHFRWLNPDPSSTLLVEKAIAMLAAYWILPATLLLFWLRYLTLQEIRGTFLQGSLAAVAAALALYASTRAGRPHEHWTRRPQRVRRLFREIARVNPLTFALVLGALLAFFTLGTIFGVPHDPRRAPQFSSSDIRRWASSALWAAGLDPYADLTEAAISTKPANWNGAEDQLPWVRGARLGNARIRYAQAYGVFLANAHLRRADFEGAFMADADLRAADLGEANLRFATLDGARITRANLDRATLDAADLARADLRDANLSYASLAGATLVDSQLNGATLYGARLSSATLLRANLEKVDFRESQLDGANLEHADLHQAYLWSAKLPDADLQNAQLDSALLIEADLHGADLRSAHFPAAVLNDANLSGANLDNADMRGALGLTAAQVCSARSHHAALFDEALQAQLDTLCPAPTP